ncbi:hypothetical protein PMAYCL1PPCAC_17362, partial [Pristionchus mayeri]
LLLLISFFTPSQSAAAAPKATTTTTTTTSTTTTTTQAPTTTTVYVSPCDLKAYDCDIGYCPKNKQIESTCSCTQCTCPTICQTGQFCQSLSSACDPCLKPSPCPSANYTCNSSTGTKVCTCAPGFTGVNCEFETGNLCQSYPCLNGGTCTGNATEYSCACPTGYRGTQCQTTGNPCSGVTCQNGGRCITVLDDTRGVCNCTENWQGASCEEANRLRTCGSSCTGVCYKPTASLNNTALFTQHTDDPMTVDKCKQIMMDEPSAEFFIIAGSICY